MMTANRTAITALAVAGMLALSVGVTVVAVGDDSGSSAAASTPPTIANTLRLAGHGSVEGVPDTLVARLRVESHQPTVQQALSGSNVAARQVTGRLTASGVVRHDIQTTNLSLNQTYDSHGRPDGYAADESITVRITPLTRVGRTLDAAATAAGNQVRIEDLSFDITDDAALLSAARARAFADAKTAATQYANLADRTLGRVLSITATVSGNRPTPVPLSYGKVLNSAASGAVPIRPGQQRVGVTVHVVWTLQ
jgi:uncharacterized protein YggE